MIDTYHQPTAAIPQRSNNAEALDGTSSWIDQVETDTSDPSHRVNAPMGIKSLRFGTTEITDTNLDGVTDQLDKAIVMANQGLSPENNPTGNATGATVFDGDIDNDLDVDADDL